MKYIIIAILTAIISPVVVVVSAEPTVNAEIATSSLVLPEPEQVAEETTAQEASESTEIAETSISSSEPATTPEPSEQPVEIAVPETQPAIEVSGTCYDWFIAGGGASSDWYFASFIFQRESNCNYKATNSSSGAYGVCQSLPANKMASAGSDWETNPVTQMRWCVNYAMSRYGSWQTAHSFWKQNNWW